MRSGPAPTSGPSRPRRTSASSTRRPSPPARPSSASRPAPTRAPARLARASAPAATSSLASEQLVLPPPPRCWRHLHDNHETPTNQTSERLSSSHQLMQRIFFFKRGCRLDRCACQQGCLSIYNNVLLRVIFKLFGYRRYNSHLQNFLSVNQK